MPLAPVIAEEPDAEARAMARRYRSGAWLSCALVAGVCAASYFYFKPAPSPELAIEAPVNAPATAPVAESTPVPPPLKPEPPAVIPVVAPPESPAAKQKKDKEKEKDKETKQNRKEIDEFFTAQPVARMMFTLSPEEYEYLRKDARRYAEATLIDLETGKAYESVAVKCKGSAGSFQQPDQRPGLTLSMNKYKGADRWRGFLKWHLNNGAQDNSLLNEQISCEMARAAGVPASRCAHVLLKWQGRDLGHYLLKEAFDQDFLSHFYKDPTGDLYDGGFVREIDLNTEKDQGEPTQRENVRELITAAREPNQEKRWARLEKILDVPQFLSFTAIESLTCHWDGYNFNRNNYRFYFDVATGKAQFFLHGTDQTFGDPNFPVNRDPGSLIGQAVMSNPAWKQAYRDRAVEIYQDVLKPTDWGARVTEIGEKVKAGIALVNPQMAKEYDGRIVEARNRVTARIAAVARQVGDMPKLYKFDKQGVAVLSAEGWQPQGTAAVVETAAREGKTCFHIRADGESSASFRKTFTLEKGKYRFSVRTATAGVVGSKIITGEGAGLRISGGSRVPPNAAVGDTGWQELGFDLESAGGEVILVAELRATKGEVWFDRDSFRLQQVK